MPAKQPGLDNSPTLIIDDKTLRRLWQTGCSHALRSLHKRYFISCTRLECPPAHRTKFQEGVRYVTTVRSFRTPDSPSAVNSFSYSIKSLLISIRISSLALMRITPVKYNVPCTVQQIHQPMIMAKDQSCILPALQDPPLHRFDIQGCQADPPAGVDQRPCDRKPELCASNRAVAPRG